MSTDVKVPPAAKVGTSEAVPVPKTTEEILNWRLKGKLPEAAAAEPAEKPAIDGAKTEKPAAQAKEAAATDKPSSAEKHKVRSQERLEEIFSIMREEDLTPAKLRALKSEVADLRAKIAQAGQSKPETTENKGPEKPKRPRWDDFNGDVNAYETAMDEYENSVAEFNANKAIENYRREEHQKATTREMGAKLEEAKARYGEEAQTLIFDSVGRIFNDNKIPTAIKAMINDSPVLVDLIYVLGEKNKEFQEFLDASYSNPSQAVRKLVLMEQLVMDELKKKPNDNAAGSEKPAEHKKPEAAAAPRPPVEVGGARGQLPNDVEEAVKENDFAKFRAIANARDLRRLKGA